MTHFKMETSLGDVFEKCFDRAKEFAMKKVDAQVEYDFNGVTVIVNKDSEYDLVSRDYDRALDGYILKQIGPDYVRELPPEVVAHEEQLRREAEARAKRKAEERRKKEEADRLAAEKLLEGCPEMMLFKDERSKQLVEDGMACNDNHGYNSCIFKMANDMARFLESHVIKGEVLTADLCKTAEKIVTDIYSPSGFQYLTSENVVSQCWKYGDQYYPSSHRYKREHSE